MKRCSVCGYEANAKDKYCHNCGSILQSEFKPKSSPKPNINIEPQPPPSEYGANVYVPDRGIWQKFFTTKGRLNPARYIFRITIVYVTCIIATLIFALFPSIREASSNTILMIAGILPIFSIIPLSMRRAHDFGRPGWYCFLGTLPLISGFFEIWFYKVVYKDSWGNYHETRNANETSFIIAFFYAMIVSVISAIYFAFRSGNSWKNDYGPNPNGECADIPFEKNPILAAISKIEEHNNSALIIGALMLLLIFIPYLSAKFYSPSHISTNQNIVQHKPNIELQEAPQQNIQHESPVQTFANENQQAAVDCLMSFHENITNRNFSRAYECLSSDYQSYMSYEGWVPGFDTTISSSVSQIQILSESDYVIEIEYVLTAIDNINGRDQTAQFDGKVTVINEGGDWKIDEIVNKAR